MELILKVSEDVGRKIKGLVVLSGKTPDEIEKELGDKMDEIITEKILSSLVGPLEKAFPTILNSIKEVYQGNQLGGLPKEEFQIQEQIQKQIQIQEQEDEYDESFANGEELSDIDQDDLEAQDQELSQEEVDPEPLQFVKEEETDVTVKNKNGKEDSYEDSFMADMQNMVDDFEPGDSDEDQIFKDAADTFREGDDNSSAVGLAKSGNIVSDVGSGEKDVLPVDFGIDSVGNNNKDAMNFFGKALSGSEGNKNMRNSSRKIKRGLQ